MFELVRRIQNIVVFIKDLIRAATDLVESKLFRRQRIAFAEGKNGLFQSLDFYKEAMAESNFSSFSMRHQSSKTILLLNRPQDSLTRKLLQTYPGARLSYFRRV